MIWKARQVSRNVTRVQLTHYGTFEQRFLLTSDRHWDNPMSDHLLQIKHLRQAKEYNAGIFDFGDFFCAMQGKWDKRANKEGLRPEHQRDDYLDALTETAATFFIGWADLFVLIGEGNHETSVLKRHETSLINNFIAKLQPTKTVNGGYSGWVHFVIYDRLKRERKHIKLHYHHGYGGGGPVTRDVIQTNRRAVYLPDADIVVSGHTHDEFVVPISQICLDNDSRIHRREQVHVKIPTYKDEYQDGWGGFHIEKGRPPKPIGAAWLRMYKDTNDSPVEFEILKAR